MRVTCKHCGGAHPAFECRKKSTAARMDVHKGKVGGTPGAPIVSRNAELERAEMHDAAQAGTQALPVDADSSREMSPVASTSAGTVGNEDRQTNSSASLRKDCTGIGLASPDKVLDAEAANNKDAHTPKRGRGRPRSITDMRSYKRDKMREYRAAKKAAN